MGIFTQIGPLLTYFAGGWLIIARGEAGLTVGTITAMERGLNGRFERVQPNLPAPQKTYLFSWICG